MAKLYVNKREPEVTAKIIKDVDRYGALELEYLTGDNAGKTVRITSSTLSRWWKANGEIEETPEEKKAVEEKEEELLTKVTPKGAKKNRPKAVKVDKQEKIDYLNILCERYGFTTTVKKNHEDILFISTKDVDENKRTSRFGELKINHTSFVLYTRRVLILDENKYSFIFDTDSSGRAKIKFDLDDATLEHVIKQLSESEERQNGKN